MGCGCRRACAPSSASRRRAAASSTPSPSPATFWRRAAAAHPSACRSSRRVAGMSCSAAWASSRRRCCCWSRASRPRRCERGRRPQARPRPVPSTRPSLPALGGRSRARAAFPAAPLARAGAADGVAARRPHGEARVAAPRLAAAAARRPPRPRDGRAPLVRRVPLERRRVHGRGRRAGRCARAPQEGGERLEAARVSSCARMLMGEHTMDQAA
mmetsp:Transcript_70854/g.188515  ORF Transcript_70854/g.188515 Transcript_70854/m.188515 type:complete len:214 (+) Transcript_70854:1203-1844(+)